MLLGRMTCPLVDSRVVSMFRTAVRLAHALLAAAWVLAFAGCAQRSGTPLEDLHGGRDLSTFTLTSVRGTRDGDRLNARVVYSNGAEEFRVDLNIAIGAPSRLESGSWTGLGGSGTVRERALTFLGGQSGPPSIGGRFDLMDAQGTALYRVTVPLQELKERL